MTPWHGARDKCIFGKKPLLLTKENQKEGKNMEGFGGLFYVCRKPAFLYLISLHNAVNISFPLSNVTYWIIHTYFFSLTFSLLLILLAENRGSSPGCCEHFASDQEAARDNDGRRITRNLFVTLWEICGSGPRTFCMTMKTKTRHRELME